ncbi:MAG: tRNA (cytidine(34)-2'-O)-methyltransferase [Pseudomonadota bacterium]
MPFHVVLFEPEIPPNTGNIIRLCANTGAQLHLIEPLGFAWDNKRLRRAGLDYHTLTHVSRHTDLDACLTRLQPANIYAFTTKASRHYHDAKFARDDVLLFGPETRGLPDEVLNSLEPDARLRIPMRGESRSLNLANAVAIALFEGWRQLDFSGAR